jgi:hypothetical protein
VNGTIVAEVYAVSFSWDALFLVKGGLCGKENSTAKTLLPLNPLPRKFKVYSPHCQLVLPQCPWPIYHMPRERLLSIKCIVTYLIME